MKKTQTEKLRLKIREAEEKKDIEMKKEFNKGKFQKRNRK